MIFTIICGCSKIKSSDVTPLLSSFSCEFSFSQSETSGSIEVDSDCTIKAIIEAPHDIYGTELEVNASETTITSGDYVKSFETDDVPIQSEIVYLYHVLVSAKVSNSQPTVNGGVISIEGLCPAGKYKIVFLENGDIEKIELTGIKSTVKFLNVIKKPLSK